MIFQPNSASGGETKYLIDSSSGVWDVAPPTDAFAGDFISFQTGEIHHMSISTESGKEVPFLEKSSGGMFIITEFTFVMPSEDVVISV